MLLHPIRPPARSTYLVNQLNLKPLARNSGDKAEVTLGGEAAYRKACTQSLAMANLETPIRCLMLNKMMMYNGNNATCR